MTDWIGWMTATAEQQQGAADSHEGCELLMALAEKQTGEK